MNNKEAPLSIPERDFILNALREDVRLDGRKADQLRPLKVSFGEEYGHVKVQLGKTRCVSVRDWDLCAYANTRGGNQFDCSHLGRSHKTA